jgi:hypothetical protein
VPQSSGCYKTEYNLRKEKSDIGHTFTLSKVLKNSSLNTVGVNSSIFLDKTPCIQWELIDVLEKDFAFIFGVEQETIMKLVARNLAVICSKIISLI